MRETPAFKPGFHFGEGFVTYSFTWDKEKELLLFTYEHFYARDSLNPIKKHIFIFL